MRTFLAVSLPEIFPDELKTWFDRHQSIPKVRWVPLRLIHVTLHFFGEIRGADLEKIKAISARIAAETKPFELFLRGCGFFSGCK